MNIKIMKNKYKNLLVLVAIIIFVYIVLAIEIYQNLVNEWALIADKQCLNVNPVIIDRKSSYAKLLQALKDKNIEAYRKEKQNYIANSKRYITAQTKWLDEQKQFMEIWNFQFFSPQYVKEAGQYQWGSRNAEVESTKLLIEAFELEQLNPSFSEELAQKSAEKTQESKEAEGKYYALWSNPPSDWRDSFISVPSSKCPAKNWKIPETEGFFNPPQPNSPRG